MQQLTYLNDLDWRAVPKEAIRLAKAASGPYQVIRDLMPSLPRIDTGVWYNPYTSTAFINYPIDTDTDKVASWHIALRQVPGVDTVNHGYLSLPPDDDPYIFVKQALNNVDVFGPVASLAQFRPNFLNKLWGGPNPLSATIGGGLLGAGLGYGGGWLAEQMLPKKYFEPGHLRKVLAVLGAGMGAAPGAWTGFDQQFRGPEQNQGWRGWLTPYQEKPANDLRDINEDWVKAADVAGGDFNATIPVDQFGRTIWNDLRSAGGFTAAPVAAATTGLLEAASMSKDNATLISPADIARIGVGMGSGYVSGLIVGKTLGALAGLKPEAQDKLQQAGIWAGILTNVVPMIFR